MSLAKRLLAYSGHAISFLASGNLNGQAAVGWETFSTLSGGPAWQINRRTVLRAATTARSGAMSLYVLMACSAVAAIAAVRAN